MGYYNASNKLIAGCREAQSEQKLRFLVDTAKAARERQDNVVAKAAAERYKAELVYQRKRSDHIMGKKERAAINKSVKYAETAYRASRKMVKHFQGMTWCGEQAAKHATEIFRLQGVVRSSFSYFGSEELRMLRDCGDTPIKIEDDEEDVAFTDTADDEDEYHPYYEQDRDYQPSHRGRRHSTGYRYY